MVAAETFEHCSGVLRGGDRDAWLCNLFAPSEVRSWLNVLYAFDVEIGRVRATVSEPMPGELRLQWWRDALERGGEGHPIAGAVCAAIETHNLPRAAFDAYLEARVFDLYDDPIENRAMLEGYAGATASALFQLAVMMTAPKESATSSDASGYGGIAVLVGRTVRSYLAAPDRFRHWLPADLVAESKSETDALRELVKQGLEDAARWRERMAGLTPKIHTLYLPVALAERDLKVLERHLESKGASVFRPPAPWLRQLQVWRAARNL